VAPPLAPARRPPRRQALSPGLPRRSRLPGPSPPPDRRRPRDPGPRLPRPAAGPLRIPRDPPGTRRTGSPRTHVPPATRRPRRPVDLRPDHQRPRGLPAPRTPHIQPPAGRPARRRRPRPPPRPLTFKPPPHTGTLMIHTPRTHMGEHRLDRRSNRPTPAQTTRTEPPKNSPRHPASAPRAGRQVGGPSAPQPPVPRTDISPADPASAQRTISSAAPDR